MIIRTRIWLQGIELRPWHTRKAPDLLTTPVDRAEDAVGFACAHYPVGSVVEYEIRQWDPEHQEEDVFLCQWEITATGWFVDERGTRHEKPGSAEVKPFGYERLVDDLTVVGIAEGFVDCANFDLELAAWQKLIDTGVAWKLQGWFGRRAQGLIAHGLCRFADPG